MLVLQQKNDQTVYITDLITGEVIEVKTLSHHAKLGFTTSQRFRITRFDTRVCQVPSARNLSTPEEE